MPLLQEQIAAMYRAIAGSQHANSLACCRGCASRSAGRPDSRYAAIAGANSGDINQLVAVTLLTAPFTALERSNTLPPAKPLL